MDGLVAVRGCSLLSDFSTVLSDRFGAVFNTQCLCLETKPQRCAPGFLWKASKATSERGAWKQLARADGAAWRGTRARLIASLLTGRSTRPQRVASPDTSLGSARARSGSARTLLSGGASHHSAPPLSRSGALKVGSGASMTTGSGVGRGAAVWERARAQLGSSLRTHR